MPIAFDTKRFLIYHTPFFLPADPLVARSKVWVFGRSLVGLAGSNPAGYMKACLL
jgi:hypothetical protein